MSRILSKIEYISMISVYYGRIDLGAKLFMQLCKESRYNWQDYKYALANTIMKEDRFWIIIEINSNRHAIQQWTVNELRYYYRFAFHKFAGEKYNEELNNFIDSFDIAPKQAFRYTDINISLSNFIGTTDFVLKLINKGFEKPRLVIANNLTNYLRQCSNNIEAQDTFIPYFESFMDITGLKIKNTVDDIKLAGESIKDLLLLNIKTFYINAEIIKNIINNNDLVKNLKCKELIIDIEFIPHDYDLSILGEALYKTLSFLPRTKSIELRYTNKKFDNIWLECFHVVFPLQNQYEDKMYQVKKLHFVEKRHSSATEKTFDRSGLELIFKVGKIIRAFENVRLIIKGNLRDNSFKYAGYICIFSNMDTFTLDLSHANEIDVINKEYFQGIFKTAHDFLPDNQSSGIALMKFNINYSLFSNSWNVGHEITSNRYHYVFKFAPDKSSNLEIIDLSK